MRTGEGWLHLATVIDLAARMVIDWQIAGHMRTSLVSDALEMARIHGGALPGEIFHSGHGAQYSAGAFTGYCQAHGFRQSMDRTGVCWDNAAAESFFAGLKNEVYHQQVFPTRTRA
ncbi:DDE-type integrase/transposase/recombinase [Corynebacterium striatum]|uniref:DDE-type integrase/transposase/recombinase n=1 Tax=Corynebacterium striatum TaxID=43770 RepID=UPI003B9863FB